MATLPVFIPLSEAARKYGLDEDYLRQMVEKGKIRAGVVAGEMVVSEEQVKERAEREYGTGEKKEDLLEYQKNAHLQGIGIGIAEAARKYNLAFSTVQNWVKVGYVKKIRQEGQKILIDEADVAYCNEIYRSRGGTRGRWLFKSDGTPYEPKRRTMIQRQ